MSAREENCLAFRRYLEWWQSGDLSRVDQVVTDTYVGHTSAGDRDRLALVERVAAFRLLYPDIVFSIEDQFATEERVVTRMRARGTHEPSGNASVLLGLNMSRIVNGKVDEEWPVWESLSDCYRSYD